MPIKGKYQKSATKSKKQSKRVALYTFLGLSTIAIAVFLVQRSTYFAPSAREVNNLPQQKLEAEAYIKYLNQYGLIKNDIDNYKLGTTNIKVFTKATTNDKAYSPKLKLYVNGITKPNYEIKNIPAISNFSILEWNIPYVIKEGDEVAVEYFNDTEANREKTVYIDNIEINGRKFYLTSSDNRVWYDRANRDDGTKYGDQNAFGTSFDNKEVLRFNDYLNFKSAGFNGDMYWNGAIHVQYRQDQNTYPQYKAEYLSDKNKNRFFDDPGLMARNEKGSCILNNGIVKCSELNFDWKYSSPDDRYDRIPGDFFLARYNASKFFYPGKYNFSFVADDGIRFYLDNKLLIDKYNVESGPRLSEVTVDIAKGNHNLKIEYLENTEQASLKFDLARISLDESQLTPAEIFKARVEPTEGLDELADDDKDGLLNVFEIVNLKLATDPLKYDSDKNGLSDAYEDTDKDGLLNILEQKYHTDPLSTDTDLDGIDDIDEIYKYKSDPNNMDSDDDGLKDGLEVELGFNPVNKDSNSNGINDFDEKTNFTVLDEETGTKLEINGQGALKEEAIITKVNETKAFGGIQAYNMVDISNPQNRTFNSVKISIPYDDSIIQKTKRKNPDDLQLVYFNESTGNIEPLQGQSIDKANKIISATTNHFSIYGLIDQETFKEVFSQEFIPSIRGTNGRLNVTFVIDDSTSMTENDPTGDRINAPVELIDGLRTDDRGAVLTFADGPIVVTELTKDKTSLKAKLNPSILNYYGETFMARAIRRGVEVLRADHEEKTARVMIVLTDGIIDDKKDLEDQVDLAKEHKVVIYTIGLGNGVNDNELKEVARETGGKYYKLSKSNELVNAYSDIRNKGKDSDEDGLTDESEMIGLRSCLGEVYKTNPNKKDTDNDGITDNEELGVLARNQFGICYNVLTSPIKADTDGDGKSDKEEQTQELKANLEDSDGDGLKDNVDSHPNRPDFYGKFRPGDIVLGGHSDDYEHFWWDTGTEKESKYLRIAMGTWSHSGIYAGDEKVIDAHPGNPNGGVDYSDISEYLTVENIKKDEGYHRFAMFRVEKKDDNTAAKVPKYANDKYFGKSFKLDQWEAIIGLTPLSDNLYCAELVERSWNSEGISFKEKLLMPWVTPKDIANSLNTTMMYIKLNK